MSGSSNDTIQNWSLKKQKEIDFFTEFSSSAISEKLCDDINIFASINNKDEVKYWNIKEQKELFQLTGFSFYGLTDSLMIFNPNEKVIANTPDDESLKLWCLDNDIKYFISCYSSYTTRSKASLKDNFTTCSYLGHIQVSVKLSLQEAFGTDLLFDPLLINTESQPTFAPAVEQVYLTTSNLKFNSSSIVLDSSKTDFAYRHALYSLIRDDLTLLSPESFQVKLSNLLCTPLHIAALKGETSVIENAIQDKTFHLTSDCFSRSPIYYSISHKHQKITDLFLGYMISIDEQNSYFFETFEAVQNDLPEIILNASDSLFDFLDMCIRSTNEPPKFGVVNDRIKYFDYRVPSFGDFLEPETDDLEPLKILYSALKLPYNVGSKSSIALFSSFLNSKNKAIYNLMLVKTFIKNRWDALHPFIVFYTMLLWGNLVFLVLMLEDPFVFYYLIPFVCINSILLLWELGQVIQSGLSYFREYWNILDLLRVSITLAWIILGTFDIKVEGILWFVALVNVSRGVSGFRAFDTTRYYIQLILQSLSSIGSFIIIFIYTTISFGILNIVSQEGNSSISINHLWIEPFGMPFGNSELGSGSELNLEYATFIIAVFLNVVLMLNMIISILGDSFDEFQTFAIYYDNKEMTQVILEIEQITSLFVSQDLKKYLHIVTNYYQSETDLWQGKVVDTRSAVDELKAKIDKKIDKDIIGKLILMDRKLETVESKIDLFEGKVEEKIDEMLKNRSSADANQNYFKGVDENIEKIRKNFDENIKTSDKNIEKIETKIDKNNKTIERMIEQNIGNSSNIESIDHKIEKIKKSVHKSNKKLESILENNEKREKEIDENIEKLGRRIEENNEKIERRIEEINEKLEKRIDEIISLLRSHN